MGFFIDLCYNTDSVKDIFEDVNSILNKRKAVLIMPQKGEVKKETKKKKAELPAGQKKPKKEKKKYE